MVSHVTPKSRIGKSLVITEAPKLAPAPAAHETQPMEDAPQVGAQQDKETLMTTAPSSAVAMETEVAPTRG